jgi:hypothetical protein
MQVLYSFLPYSSNFTGVKTHFQYVTSRRCVCVWGGGGIGWGGVGGIAGCKMKCRVGIFSYSNVPYFQLAEVWVEGWWP